MKTNQRGITLIALVVTIVVLLILAGISISILTGENGIIKQAQEAKENTEIAREKEIIKLSTAGAKTKNNWKEITEENLEKELTSYIGKRNEDYTLTGTGPFIVTYTDSGRSYIIYDNGDTEENDEIIVEPENPDDWEYIVENGVATLTKYKGNAEILVVPNYIDGIPVKQVGNGEIVWDERNHECIAEYATGTVTYEYLQIKIKEIIISEGIEKIAEDCFRNIQYLVDVTIPESVKDIDHGAFYFSCISDYGDIIREGMTLKIPKTVINLGRNIVGVSDIIQVEFKNESEIPNTWDEGWNKAYAWNDTRVEVIWAQ